MRAELSGQLGEHDVGTIVEVAPVICLNDLIDDIKGCYHNINPDNIPLWNDWPVSYSSSWSCNAFLYFLLDPALKAASRHESAKNNQKIICRKNNTNDIRFYYPKKKKSAL
jgi:hypothetical protein